MIDWLTSTAFTAFGAPTTWAEVLGFATGLVNVALLVRQHILNWPLGILNAAVRATDELLARGWVFAPRLSAAARRPIGG